MSFTEGQKEFKGIVSFKELSFEHKNTGAVEIKFLGRALTKEMILELEKALEVCEGDNSVDKIILTGQGKYFCLGGDIRQFADAGKDLPKLIQEMASALDRVIIKMAQCTKPVIARVNGVAAGAGLSIVAAADRAVALKQASFVSGFTKIGLSPDGGLTYSLPEKLRRKMGERTDETVRSIVEDNEVVDAGRAKEIGLIDEVANDAGAADRWVESVGEDSKFPFDNAALMQNMRAELSEMTHRAGLPETQERVKKFLEKK